MASVYVDFSAVAPEHEAIDARLANWARWCHNRTGGTTSPTFRLYRSTEVHRQQTGGANPVDAIDAQKVQKAVAQLPTKHRLALSWSYIKRNNPRRAAADLGQSLQGLADLVRDGRQMLINLGC